jgi:hypothetical protein
MAPKKVDFRPRAFSLRDRDVAELKQAARASGLNASAALRLAIHDYAVRERRRARAEAKA